MKNQLFVILKETFDALSGDEIKATVEALKEVGLYALPYPSVDVRIYGDCVSFIKESSMVGLEGRIKRGLMVESGVLHEGQKVFVTNYGDGHWMDYNNISLDHCNYDKVSVIDKTNKKMKPTTQRVAKFSKEFLPTEIERDTVADMLIVLLTTRNAVKTTVRNKLAALGIGKNKHEYTTTISLPREMEDDPDHVPTNGAARCPHLRRGHKRSQHYGPRNALVKEIYVASTFVNADKEWTKTRVAYNVSL